jgi:choline transport protein
MLYGYMFAFLGALATCASMAEMASMYAVSYLRRYCRLLN